MKAYWNCELNLGFLQRRLNLFDPQKKFRSRFQVSDNTPQNFRGFIKFHDKQGSF